MQSAFGTFLLWLHELKGAFLCGNVSEDKKQTESASVVRANDWKMQTRSINLCTQNTRAERLVLQAAKTT